MDDLKLTPFSDKEMEYDYSTQTFNERGVDFTLIRLSNQQKPQSGNLYKFGLVDNEYNFYWFFYNKAIVKGRLKALEKSCPMGWPIAWPLSDWCNASLLSGL